MSVWQFLHAVVSHGKKQNPNNHSTLDNSLENLHINYLPAINLWLTGLISLISVSPFPLISITAWYLNKFFDLDFH